VYETGHGPAGGPARTSGSPEVRSETTRRGITPNKESPDLDGPSSTGRRPVRSIEVTTCSTAAEDRAPAASDAAGCPQKSRTTGANSAAVAAETKTTLADGPMEAHSEDAAATEPS
jgi:hypothetical protein